MKTNTFLSILAIFKNEKINLKEWLDHYEWQGVEHFYLIDNGSEDSPLEILEPYIKSNKVTYEFRPEPFQQVKHYQNIYSQYDLRHNTKWLIMADLDEFWYGVDGSKISNLLKNYINYDVLYSKWKVFGSSGLESHPKSIRESFVMRHPVSQDVTKWIAQTKNIDALDLHIHHILNHPNYTQIDGVIDLNHYAIQSKEFFEKVKMVRGDVNIPEFQNGRNWGYFNSYDALSTIKDEILSDLVKKSFV